MRKSSPERRAASETVAAELKLLRETIELATSPSADAREGKSCFFDGTGTADRQGEGRGLGGLVPALSGVRGRVARGGRVPAGRERSPRVGQDAGLGGGNIVETAEAAEAPEAEAPSAAETPVEAVAPEAEASEPTKGYPLNPKPVPAKKVTTTVVTTKTLARAGSGRRASPEKARKAEDEGTEATGASSTAVSSATLEADAPAEPVENAPENPPEEAKASEPAAVAGAPAAEERAPEDAKATKAKKKKNKKMKGTGKDAQTAPDFSEAPSTAVTASVEPESRVQEGGARGGEETETVPAAAPAAGTRRRAGRPRRRDVRRPRKISRGDSDAEQKEKRSRRFWQEEAPNRGGSGGEEAGHRRDLRGAEARHRGGGLGEEEEIGGGRGGG